VRQLFEIPLSDDDSSPNLGSERESDGLGQVKNSGPRVNVAVIPSSDRTCRHHVFVDDNAHLKKLDLPSAACVVVSQQFEACAGEMVMYDFVVLLRAIDRFGAGRPAVRAVIVNRTTGSADWLMDRSMNGCTNERRVGSRFRESQSFTVPTAGHYELRFMTLVDSNHPGSEAHLLVDSVRVVDSSGKVVKRLASLSCVGRVQHSLPTTYMTESLPQVITN
jgi:hypothetical protein